MKIIVYLSVLMLVLAGFGACKKSAGPGGKNTITGTIYYKDGEHNYDVAAGMANVSIIYGADTDTGNYDKTLVANSSGQYSFEGLNKGKYFIKATFTDSHGFKYATPGYAVELEHKKKTIAIDMVLE